MRMATLETLLDNFMVGHLDVVMVDVDNVTGSSRMTQDPPQMLE